MRVQGNQGLTPLDRRGTVGKGASTEGSQRAERSERGEVQRESQALHRQAQALADSLRESALEERPGATERAAKMLAEPFDEQAARETALRMLVGERSPGEGRSLLPENPPS